MPSLHRLGVAWGRPFQPSAHGPDGRRHLPHRCPLSVHLDRFSGWPAVIRRCVQASEPRSLAGSGAPAAPTPRHLRMARVDTEVCKIRPHLTSLGSHTYPFRIRMRERGGEGMCTWSPTRSGVIRRVRLVITSQILWPEKTVLGASRMRRPVTPFSGCRVGKLTDRPPSV